MREGRDAFVIAMGMNMDLRDGVISALAPAGPRL
jgi:hypothetical protein